MVNTGNVFLDVFKNTDQNNIGASIVFKAKYEETFFKGFYLKTQKCPFLGVNKFFFLIFFSVLAFKTQNCMLINIFKKGTKNCY